MYEIYTHSNLRQRNVQNRTGATCGVYSSLRQLTDAPTRVSWGYACSSLLEISLVYQEEGFNGET